MKSGSFSISNFSISTAWQAVALGLGLLLSPVRAPAQASLGDTLSSGTAMYTNQALLSSNREYELVLQADSNLVLYDLYAYNGGDNFSPRALWASNTYRSGAGQLSLQTDGNLVLYAWGGRAKWASNTVGAWHPHLFMQNDGNLILIDQSGRAVWDTGTWRRTTNHPVQAFLGSAMGVNSILQTGQALLSPNGRYEMVLQDDSNLVVYDLYSGGNHTQYKTAAVWASYTWGSGARRLVQQADGNLVLYDQAGRAQWASNTVGAFNPTLAMQNDGYLVLRDYWGRIIWTTKPAPPSTGTDTVALGQDPQQPALFHGGTTSAAFITTIVNNLTVTTGWPGYYTEQGVSVDVTFYGYDGSPIVVRNLAPGGSISTAHVSANGTWDVRVRDIYMYRGEQVHGSLTYNWSTNP